MTCQDSSVGGPSVGNGQEQHRKRSRDEGREEEEEGNVEQAAGQRSGDANQQPKDLFVGERPFRTDLSSLSSRMMITAQKAYKANYSNKMHKETYVYGNYPGYYGVRLDDTRLQALDRNWFHGRECVDVGCHEGVFTLSIVKKFRPASMIAIDIDPKLALKTARINLKKELEKARSDGDGDGGDVDRRAIIGALKGTRFFAGDYAVKEGAPESVDTITCFSVIKWIHFHHGDDGIKFVFGKIFNSLRPGGVFILEPQPWESYSKAKRKQNMVGVPFYDLTLLKLRPPEFLDHLVNKVGFEHVKSLAFPDVNKGFSRPMFILRKPKTKG